MYNQGNYGSQFGQGGSQPPVPQFLQRPVPPFPQGPPSSHPSTLQQGPPVLPLHVGHSGPLYHHAAPLPVQQGPPAQVPTNGMPIAGHSYLPPPPPPSQQVHGSSNMVHSNSNVQNSQWTHNMHHMPPAVPPLHPPSTGPSGPEMFRLPPRVLPQVAPPGHTSFRGPIHLPQSGSLCGSQPITPPPPPPPSASSFFTPASFESSIHSVRQDSSVPAPGPMPPPNPPSSPPPLPPSPPPPTSPLPFCSATSSTPNFNASHLSYHSESGPISNHSGFGVTASVNTLIRDDMPALDDHIDPAGAKTCEVGSLVKEDLSTPEGNKSDLPPPPPKPTEEKVIRKIEVICNFIAKNGPGFEDMARQKESGNPEFEFLFGGEPGSEAAIAHEYFEWMKKKCILAGTLQHDRISSVRKPSGLAIKMENKFSTEPCVSRLSCDSDMDMEDDITQTDEERQAYASFESIKPMTILIAKELDAQEQFHTRDAVEYSVAEETASKASGLAERDKAFKPSADHDHFTHESSLSEGDSSIKNSAGASEFPSNSNEGKFSGELSKGASPFRLLQDYASDDSSESDAKPCFQGVSHATTSLLAMGATSLHGDIGSNSQMDAGSKGLLRSEMASGKLSESNVVYSRSMPSNAPEIAPESQRINTESNIKSTPTANTEEIVGKNTADLESIDNTASPEDFQHGALDGFCDSAREGGQSQTLNEDVNVSSTLPKVDEFGRLVREGANDSDSDESRYGGRRGKRGRSWSRSQSPDDRRRRSPRRRKEKRSRSRSWSPRKRRSRSRSPAYRRGGESGSDRMRREKGKLPECFDFLRGRCHRGAFCRYMHHEPDRGPRSYRNRERHVEVPHLSRTSDFHEEVEKRPPKRSLNEEEMPESSFGASKDGKRYGELVPVQNAVQAIISNQDDKSLDAKVAKSDLSREVPAIVQETRNTTEDILESTAKLVDKEICLKRVEIETVKPVENSPLSPLTGVGTPISCGDTSHGMASSVENLVITHSQANPSHPALQDADCQPQQVDDSSTSDSSQVQTSAPFQNLLAVGGHHLNMIPSSYPGTSSITQSFSSQLLPPKESLPPTNPAVGFQDHHSQLPPPPPPPPLLSQGRSIPPPPELPREHNCMQSTSSFSPLSPFTDNCPPYAMQNQHSQFAVPPNSSWSWPPPLPPPPPPVLPTRPSFVNHSTVNAATATQGASLSDFQQNPLPTRNAIISQTFLRPYPLEVLAHSQVGEFQHHKLPRMQDRESPLHPPHLEDSRPKALPLSNPMTQPFGVAGFVGDNHLSGFLAQGLNPSYPFAHGQILPQALPSLRDSAARRMQSFPGDNLASVETFESSSQNQPYMQQQRSSYHLQLPADDGRSLDLTDYGSINSTNSRYASTFDKNETFHLSGFRGSRISNYFNPYASTFDQPLNSKFSSVSFSQDNNMPCNNRYDAPCKLGHTPVEGSLGSRHMTSSPRPAQYADIPRSRSDQYDPLFDSIEPSSNSVKKFGNDPKNAPANDSITLRQSGSHKPLDVEENNKQKDVEVLTVTTSAKSENDEYGETADAEVGDVENASASNSLDAANAAVGDIEIDQVKTPGKKSKKSKHSRSMKLFKVALADFVKEELKPFWRQGNMSKEAFKTIVKKTIDKVSGAMKSHQVPKSQAKINQYIDSSQRKLTKLVMGYVKKYVKV